MAILFIHGLFPAICDPPADWLCPDLPGYGVKTAAAIGLPEAAEFLSGLITEPVHLVGHSIGGAIAMLLATNYPECVASVVNVEGNFTLNDAFWSSRLAAMTAAQAEQEMDRLRADPTGWLTNAGVPISPATLAIAERSLATPAKTIHAMARSVVDITSKPAYLEHVRAVIDRGIPLHLIAGEHSRDAWDVPKFILTRAHSCLTQPEAGHMLMWNDQQAFVELVEFAIQ